MSKKAVLAVVAIVVLGGLWYAFRPEKLIVNQSVNETFPTAQAAQPVEVANGMFHGVAHDGRGTVTIYRLPEGKRVLRLTNFETSNGPQLELYLVAENDVTDSDAVKKAGFVSLGPLKGNKGDQNYDVPAGTDLSKYRAVTVWCARFNVNFTTAPLQAGGMQAAQPAALASGQFHKVAHDGMGQATVYQLADGKRVLRLTNFETSNGPQLELYLVAANDATDSEMVKKAGYVSLGPLKGNKGDQNDDVPVDLDLNKYKAVTVWCARFNVNFTTAPLALETASR